MIITIVDYGIGNVASVKNMLHKNGTPGQISNDANEILKSDKIILPGVGSFDAAMKRLSALNLVEVIRTFSATGKPLLGICLGAQLLMDSSEEGQLNGLGLIKGTCKKFKGIEPLSIPHMGWSEVNFTREEPIVTFNNSPPRFYFVHSYHIVCENQKEVLGVSEYGYQFTCAVSSNNIFGVQFHPEKSHRYGAELLKNFASL